ncbi:hypothetical protein [Acinetobacter venetianus]|uniref:hypothetical protein n=1 Tax=Acinetobacter venetianus TaxID=52133 RepID=UPI002AC1420B|nr:hypothetical protein [Acinetobacter venetianus]
MSIVYQVKTSCFLSTHQSDNKAIRSVQQVGATVSIEMQDGFIHADVNKVTNND